jgi:hypothetical protein
MSSDAAGDLFLCAACRPCHPNSGELVPQVEWDALPLVGRQEVPAGGPDEPAYTLEMRNCHCGSTLAKEVV